MSWLLSIAGRAWGIVSGGSPMLYIAAALAVAAAGYVGWTQLALSHRAARIETLEARLSTVEAQRDRATATAEANARTAERLAGEMRAANAAVERANARAAALAENTAKIIRESRREPDANDRVPRAWLPYLTGRVPGAELGPPGRGPAGQGGDSGRAARPAR